MIALSFRRAAIFAFLSFVLYNKCGDVWNSVLSRFGNKTNVSNELMFTITDLEKYDGKTYDLLYLSLMGRVYDVTKGRKHYGQGCTYSFFVGKDATRSFITGEFTEQLQDVDDVSDLSDADLDGLTKWIEMYENQYIYKGNLIGRYYDEQGHETEYLKNIKSRVKMFHSQQSLKENLQKQYPPCNVEWDVKIGTRVWCTKQSGGIERDWIGVPRQLYEAGSKEPRCACINYDDSSLLDKSSMKPYENCAVNSESCYVESD